MLDDECYDDIVYLREQGDDSVGSCLVRAFRGINGSGSCDIADDDF